MKWLLIMLYAAKLADLGTTEMVLSRGGYEANPFQVGPVRYAITAVAPYAIYKLATKAKSKKTGVAVCVAWSVLWSTTAYLNYRQYNKSKGFRVQITIPIGGG